jgi:hypothetical protein
VVAVVDISWNGPDPTDTALCPYAVYFYCKPAPAESLSSLESGRLLLQVDLAGEDDVDEDATTVAGQLINNAKQENLKQLDDGSSKIKHQTSVSTTFVKDTQQPKRWHGELSIPASWVEGSTKSHEKTRAVGPSSGRIDLYTLEITYTLSTNGNRCTARFGSEDAFHWQAGPRAPV